MTSKPLKKRSVSRAAKATTRKNSKATAPKQPGITKLALLVAHLSAPGGATIAELCKARAGSPIRFEAGSPAHCDARVTSSGPRKKGALRRYRIEEPVV